MNQRTLIRPVPPTPSELDAIVAEIKTAMLASGLQQIACVASKRNDTIFATAHAQVGQKVFDVCMLNWEWYDLDGETTATIYAQCPTSVASVVLAIAKRYGMEIVRK